MLQKVQVVLVQKLDGLGCVEELLNALVAILSKQRAVSGLVVPVVEAVVTHVVSKGGSQQGEHIELVQADIAYVLRVE